MTTSEYEYITLAELEAEMIYIFDAVDARYIDTAVEAKITAAERWVNEYCGQSFTAGAAPGGVKYATLEMAAYLMNRQMLSDKWIEELPVKYKDVLDLVKEPLAKHKVDIDYTSSRYDFHLPSLR